MASPPEEFLCPINLTIMKDPVIGPDGHSYERTAITQWLQRNPHSTLTRQPMTIRSLQTNISLRSAIERYTQAKSRAPAPRAHAPRAKPAPATAPRAPAPRAPAPRAPPAPSAPPMDYEYAVATYHEELSRPFLSPQPTIVLPVAVPVAPAPSATLVIDSRASEQARRKKFLGACACLTVVIIIVIIISRLYESMGN